MPKSAGKIVFVILYGASPVVLALLYLFVSPAVAGYCFLAEFAVLVVWLAWRESIPRIWVAYLVVIYALLAGLIVTNTLALSLVAAFGVYCLYSVLKWLAERGVAVAPRLREAIAILLDRQPQGAPGPRSKRDH